MKILVIIPFYNVYPPMNGGMVRCINLLQQLNRHFEVTAVMHQHSRDFQNAVTDYPALNKGKVISTDEQAQVKDMFSYLPSKWEHALRYRYWTMQPFASAGTDFLKIYPVLKKLLQQEVFDTILLEDILLMDLVPLIRQLQPKAPIIYDAYNVNSRLMKTEISDAASEKRYRQMFKAECSLYSKVDAAFVCSETDLNELSGMNKKKLTCIVIPNGVNVAPAHDYKPALQKEILFCGSLDYGPNREGLQWFFEKIFSRILELQPGAKLSVVGKGDPGELLTPLLKHPSVIYHGMVAEVAPYYKRAALAVVPLLSGSGTRLKVLEAMGLGVPVLSTTIGAEGINHTDGKNILIADDAESFAQKTIQLLNEPGLAESVSIAAYNLVKKEYDWNVVGERMKEYFSKGQVLK